MSLSAAHTPNFSHDHSPSTHSSSNVVAWICGPVVIAIVALTLALWSPAVPEANAVGQAQAVSAAPASVSTFDYYPAQFVNQGKDAESHIEAF